MSELRARLEHRLAMVALFTIVQGLDAGADEVVVPAPVMRAIANSTARLGRQRDEARAQVAAYEALEPIAQPTPDEMERCRRSVEVLNRLIDETNGGAEQLRLSDDDFAAIVDALDRHIDCKHALERLVAGLRGRVAEQADYIALLEQQGDDPEPPPAAPAAQPPRLLRAA